MIRGRKRKSKIIDPADPVLGIAAMSKKGLGIQKPKKSRKKKKGSNTESNSTNIVINGDINPFQFSDLSNPNSFPDLSNPTNNTNTTNSSTSTNKDGLMIEIGKSSDPLSQLDQSLLLTKKEKYVSDHESMLNNVFGANDVLAECFMCNFNSGKHTNVPLKLMNALNQKAFQLLNDGPVINAVYEIYNEFESARNYLNRYTYNNCVPIEEWTLRSIRWHYLKHIKDPKSLENKFDTIINETVDVVKENIIELENKERVVNEKYITHLEKLVKMHKLLHK